MVFRSPPPVLGALALSCILLAITLARLAVGAFWPVPFSVDEAQYVSWSRELAAGYYSKPPFIAWALAAAQGFCATGSEACARSLQPLAFFGAAVATFVLGLPDAFSEAPAPDSAVKRGSKGWTGNFELEE